MIVMKNVQFGDFMEKIINFDFLSSISSFYSPKRSFEFTSSLHFEQANGSPRREQCGRKRKNSHIQLHLPIRMRQLFAPCSRLFPVKRRETKRLRDVCGCEDYYRRGIKSRSLSLAIKVSARPYRS